LATTAATAGSITALSVAAAQAAVAAAEGSEDDAEEDDLEEEELPVSSFPSPQLQQYVLQLLLLYQILASWRSLFHQLAQDWLQHSSLQQWDMRTVLWELCLRRLGKELEQALHDSREKYGLEGPHPLNGVLSVLGRRWRLHVAGERCEQCRCGALEACCMA
jgi:hypothetical protein